MTAESVKNVTPEPSGPVTVVDKHKLQCVANCKEYTSLPALRVHIASWRLLKLDGLVTFLVSVQVRWIRYVE